ncbi:MAG: thiamine-phosphate kinase [Myxococcota bacterium]
MSESQVLTRVKAKFAGLIPPGAFQWNDDAALLPAPSPSASRVVSVDQMIEGIHFLARSGLDSAGWRLVVRNLSDLAAMGAHPVGMLWTLSLPVTWLDDDAAMLDAFLTGAARAAHDYGVPLFGGDLSHSFGGFHATLTIFGDVSGNPLRRSGARVGDLVAISRPVGWSQLGLEVVLHRGGQARSRALRERAKRAHLWPRPELEVGTSLVDVASACLDISDGLARDASRLADASGVALLLDEEGLMQGAPSVGGYPASLERVLSSGDEYALLFTLPPERSLPRGAQLIGCVEAGQGVYVHTRGVLRPVQPEHGFDHFSSS